jgi:hypothetical protein
MENGRIGESRGVSILNSSILDPQSSIFNSSEVTHDFNYLPDVSIGPAVRFDR